MDMAVSSFRQGMDIDTADGNPLAVTFLYYSNRESSGPAGIFSEFFLAE
jgi:hypothetical protein